jgi:hypothetical protein
VISDKVVYTKVIKIHVQVSSLFDVIFYLSIAAESIFISFSRKCPFLLLFTSKIISCALALFSSDHSIFLL